MKSLAEVDQEIADGKTFATNLGEDGMKKLRELSAAAIASSESNLFAISPKMSYEPESWSKAYPAFWGQK